MADAIKALLQAAPDTRLLRDLTRRGLATALNEVALDGRFCIEIEEAAVPIADQVAGACEMLGLDPLYVANEGRFVAIVDNAAGARGATPLFRHTRLPSHRPGYAQR